MQYWCSRNGQQEGPYSLKNIRKLELMDNTLVFRSDQTEWKRKSDFKELLSFDKYQNTTQPTTSQIQHQANFIEPSLGNQNAKYISTPFNWWMFLLILSVFAYILYYSLLFSSAVTYNMAILLYLLASILLITTSIFGYILLYRHWKIIQDGNVRVTPGSAVGLCFIPFFNFYWIFQAIYGLSVDQEKYLEEKIVKSAVIPNKGIALATCISICIPIIGLLPALICGILTFKNQKDISLEILKNR